MFLKKSVSLLPLPPPPLRSPPILPSSSCAQHPTTAFAHAPCSTFGLQRPSSEIRKLTPSSFKPALKGHLSSVVLWPSHLNYLPYLNGPPPPRHSQFFLLQSPWRIPTHPRIYLHGLCLPRRNAGWGRVGVVFLALPMTSSRWKQELKKRVLGLPPVDCELQVSHDPTALQPERERSVRSERKTPRAGGALSGHSTWAGRLGPGERDSGVMARVMASASGAKWIGARVMEMLSL